MTPFDPTCPECRSPRESHTDREMARCVRSHALRVEGFDLIPCPSAPAVPLASAALERDTGAPDAGDNSGSASTAPLFQSEAPKVDADSAGVGDRKDAPAGEARRPTNPVDKEIVIRVVERLVRKHEDMGNIVCIDGYFISDRDLLQMRRAAIVLGLAILHEVRR